MLKLDRWFPWVAVMMVFMAVVDVVGALQQTPIPLRVLIPRSVTGLTFLLLLGERWLRRRFPRIATGLGVLSVVLALVALVLLIRPQVLP